MTNLTQSKFISSRGNVREQKAETPIVVKFHSDPLYESNYRMTTAEFNEPLAHETDKRESRYMIENCQCKFYTGISEHSDTCQINRMRKHLPSLPQQLFEEAISTRRSREIVTQIKILEGPCHKNPLGYDCRSDLDEPPHRVVNYNTWQARIEDQNNLYTLLALLGEDKSASVSRFIDLCLEQLKKDHIQLRLRSRHYWAEDGRTIGKGSTFAENYVTLAKLPRAAHNQAFSFATWRHAKLNMVHLSACRIRRPTLLQAELQRSVLITVHLCKTTSMPSDLSEVEDTSVELQRQVKSRLTQPTGNGITSVERNKIGLKKKLERRRLKESRESIAMEQFWASYRDGIYSVHPDEDDVCFLNEDGYPVCKRRSSTNYIAVSHRWTDVFKSESDSRATLTRLSARLSERSLGEKQNGKVRQYKRYNFWMDKVSVRDRYRRQDIKDMGNIYHEATMAVVVLGEEDSLLVSALTEEGQLPLMLAVRATRWASRVWTQQEFFLPKKVLVASCEGELFEDHWENLVNSQYYAVLQWVLRTPIKPYSMDTMEAKTLVSSKVSTRPEDYDLAIQGLSRDEIVVGGFSGEEPFSVGPKLMLVNSDLILANRVDPRRQVQCWYPQGRIRELVENLNTAFYLSQGRLLVIQAYWDVPSYKVVARILKRFGLSAKGYVDGVKAKFKVSVFSAHENSTRVLVTQNTNNPYCQHFLASGWTYISITQCRAIPKGETIVLSGFGVISNEDRSKQRVEEQNQRTTCDEHHDSYHRNSIVSGILCMLCNTANMTCRRCETLSTERALHL